MKTRTLNTAHLSFPLATATAALLGLFATPAAHAAARTWSGGDGDWQTGVQGGWNGVWANGDTATFNVSGVGTVTVQSAIATGNAALAFTAGHYTLQSDGATERVVTLGNDNVTLGNGVTTTIGSIKVETSVSRRPPRRSRRAELPHRAPQECALVELRS